MAEYYLSIGNAGLATGQLRMALEAPGVNTVDRARYQARLKQINDAMPPEQRRRDAGDARRQPQP
jgi:predicted Zn-dependent protease